jgi:hypothetical protein
LYRAVLCHCLLCHQFAERGVTATASTKHRRAEGNFFESVVIEEYHSGLFPNAD